MQLEMVFSCRYASRKLFVDKNGNIVPIDFGIMGRIDKLNRRYLAEILYGFIQRDYKKVAEVHIVAGLSTERGKFRRVSTSS